MHRGGPVGVPGLTYLPGVKNRADDLVNVKHAISLVGVPDLLVRTKLCSHPAGYLSLNLPKRRDATRQIGLRLEPMLNL